MVLAEIEVFVSPPHAPTRRISMGRRHLPVDGSMGFAAVLVGGIASRFSGSVDEDTAEALDALVDDAEAGRRIAQPRVRHRLQDDRVGLKRTVHRLVGVGDTVEVSVAERPGTPTQHLLAAAYTVAAMPPEQRSVLAWAFRYGASWRGELDATFIARLSRHRAEMVVAGPATVAWALSVLDLTDVVSVADGRVDADRSTIMKAFRGHLLDAHPDRGADHRAAADRISELSEARRILMAHR